MLFVRTSHPPIIEWFLLGLRCGPRYAVMALDGSALSQPGPPRAADIAVPLRIYPSTFSLPVWRTGRGGAGRRGARQGEAAVRRDGLAQARVGRRQVGRPRWGRRGSPRQTMQTWLMMSPRPRPPLQFPCCPCLGAPHPYVAAPTPGGPGPPSGGLLRQSAPLCLSLVPWRGDSVARGPSRPAPTPLLAQIHHRTKSDLL